MDIANLRLVNQHVSASKFTKVKDLVAYFGAMQAQDYSMAKWAIGVRLPGSTSDLIENALDNGEILRTHVLRPTWHFVSSNDIKWMTELSASRIIAAMKTRNKELELTDLIFKKSNLIIQNSLAGGNNLTREDLIANLRKSGIATDNNRASHIFFQAELEGLICSGRKKGNKLTYALLNERAPHTKSLSREHSLEKLAFKYFSSHGPATIKDFTWWSGLTVKEAASAMEMIRPSFITEKTDAGVYMLPGDLNDSVFNEGTYLLPAYDEFLISYRDRSASMSLVHHKKAISDNGIFRPLIVINGQVAGLWKKNIIKEKVIVEPSLFKSYNKKIMNSIERKAEAFGNFLGKKTIMKFGIF